VIDNRGPTLGKDREVKKLSRRGRVYLMDKSALVPNPVGPPYLDHPYQNGEQDQEQPPRSSRLLLVRVREGVCELVLLDLHRLGAHVQFLTHRTLVRAMVEWALPKGLRWKQRLSQGADLASYDVHPRPCECESTINAEKTVSRGLRWQSSLCMVASEG